MTTLPVLLLSLLSLLAALNTPVSASNDACAIDDEAGLLQMSHDTLRSAAFQQTEGKKPHTAPKASDKLDRPENVGKVEEGDDLQEEAPGVSLPAAAMASEKAGKKPEKPENDMGVTEESDVRNDALKAKEGVVGKAHTIPTARPTGGDTTVTDSKKDVLKKGGVVGKTHTIPTTRPTGSNTTVTDSKKDKVVEILIPGSKGASSTVLRILNPERIDAQKAVNESMGSIVKVENTHNMVLKATNVEDGQRTVYDEGEKRVAQASTKISISASTKGKIHDFDELLAQAKKALRAAQHNMQALKNATQATLAAKGKVRNATLAKDLAEKRLDQLASNPGVVHSTVAGVEEAAQLAKQTIKLDGEASEDRESARAADADRQAVASRMARQVALAAEYCACGYEEAAESTDGAHVNFTKLAEEFRQEPARVAELRAKLAMAKAAKGEGDALARSAVKVRTKDKIKLRTGEEVPAGSVVIIQRPAAMHTALDEDSGENVLTIEDPENIFVGDDWDESMGIVNNATEVSSTNINGSAVSLLETSLLEGPNLTDLQQDLHHGYINIEQTQTLLKEFSVGRQKTKALAKELANAIEVRNALSKELQQYANQTADISKNIQADVLSNSNSSRNSTQVEAGIKLDVGKGKKQLLWQMLDNKTASDVVNQTVSVQEAAEKVASLATKAGQASVKCQTLEQSWRKADSHQRGLAIIMKARLRKAILSSSLSLGNLQKSGAQVDLAAISRSLGECPPSTQAVVGLRDEKEEETQPLDLALEVEDRKEEEDQPLEVERQLPTEGHSSSKEKTRVNWWTISLTGIIILVTLMMVAMLWWPFAT